MTRTCTDPSSPWPTRRSLALALVCLPALNCRPAAGTDLPPAPAGEGPAQLWLGPLEVEVNHAERADLERVRGVGPGLAEAILVSRQRRLFANWDDLVRRLPGVGPASARRLSRAGLRVQGQAYPASATPTPDAPAAAPSGAAR